MKYVVPKDVMIVSNCNTAEIVQQSVKQIVSKKKNSATKLSHNTSNDTEIQYDTPENTVVDLELIPFGRRMSKTSIPIDSYISIESAIESQKLLEQFVNEVLIADVDYGFIQGYAKPSLMKSGAEKLCNFYRLISRVEVISRIDEFQLPFFSREVKIVLLDSIHESIRGEGVGSCNSKEAKYRREDPYMLQNTILKIAKKRALIDAVLNVSGLSSRFTQDIEDFTLMEGVIAESKPITIKQYQYLTDLIKSNGISREEYFSILKDKFQVESLKQLDSAQMSQLITMMKNYNKVQEEL